ncbi:MAG TPA: acyltransferase [Intrasporangium sp.]|nr:acyltransferase [Intrasporangium sp.]
MSALADPARQSPEELALVTPDDRDRFADLLRAGSLIVVVLGHWLMVVVTPDGEVSNVLSLVPSLQPLTWVLQVMPLFFLVGGVAHSYALDSLDRRGGSRRGRYVAFVSRRAVRLLRPTLAFLAVWVVLGALAHVTGLTSLSGPDGGLARDALVMVPQLLWFVAIYLGVCACAPAMRRLHKRIGLYAAVLLALAAVLVDVVRFAVPPLVLVGNLNFAFVWLALHQLGFAWRDGLLSARRGWAMFVGGYGAMLGLITFGPYPTSMVGLPGEAVSNMAPPSAALLAQGIGIAGLAVVLRGPAARLLARPDVWAVVLRVAPFAMTAFLWHLTALMLVELGRRAVGLGEPEVASWAWWATRPGLFLILALLTAGLVAVFVRCDQGSKPLRGPVLERRAWVDPLAALAALAIFFGILMVSIVGVDVLGNRPVFFLFGDITPVVGFAVLATGLALLRLTRPQVTPPRVERA